MGSTKVPNISHSIVTAECRNYKQLWFTGLEAEAEELDISSCKYFELLGARPCSGV